ncbi:hypothetical protein MNB_SM-5-266 [hydrothermal vent metagenome]|uniref:Uncharacterized protein n=1 Tax=hydrothermal vent metagenome TaxID=652676 RepID=A0A1W1CCA0_9ZZZZ
MAFIDTIIYTFVLSYPIHFFASMCKREDISRSRIISHKLVTNFNIFYIFERSIKHHYFCPTPKAFSHGWPCSNNNKVPFAKTCCHFIKLFKACIDSYKHRVASCFHLFDVFHCVIGHLWRVFEIACLVLLCNLIELLFDNIDYLSRGELLLYCYAFYLCCECKEMAFE